MSIWGFVNLFSFIFKSSIENKINNNFLNKILLLKITWIAFILLNDIFNKAKENFRAYINIIQIDRVKKKYNLFWRIYKWPFSNFNNDNDFWLELKK